MSVDTAEIVFFAIAGVMGLIWLAGTAFAFSRLKPRGRGEYDVAPSPDAAAEAADAVVGEATFDGDAESLSKKIAEQLIAATFMGGASPLEITERTPELVAFKRSMSPGGPAAVFDEGLFRLRAEGGKVHVQYAVSMKRFTAIMRVVTPLVCFLWGGYWVIGVPVLLWFLVVHHANEKVRWQVFQTLQMVHGVWPPFLVGFLGSKLRRMTATFFQTFLANLQHVAWTRRAGGGRLAKCEIIVGTSGYQYKDWVGPFYPEGTRPEKMLELYAARFAAVEINFTYYGMPRAKQMERMAERTPDGFRFVVKAHRTTTHEMSLDDIPAFVEAMRPLEERGRFSGVLCQFPWRFKNSKEARAHLAAVREAFGEAPVFVEFRHASWITEPVFKFLQGSGLLYVSVDEPEIEGLVPRVGRLTGDTGYLRFHSRRGSTWWGSGGKLRYDYDYSEAEMREWIPTLEEFASSARRVFVFFNNCHRGQAAANAESFRAVLQAAGLVA